MTWTAERMDQLTKLWADGLSASQIAVELGGITRNAVIGKAHRLGLQGREVYGPRPQIKRKPRAPRAELKVVYRLDRDDPTDEMPVERVEDLAIPVEQRRQLLELEPCHCRWPVGDPDKPGFFFCGSDVEYGRPYCSQHSAVAFTGVPTRSKVYAMRRRAA